MFRQLTPELCATENVKINGKQGNALQSALARQAWEQAHAYKAGSCRILYMDPLKLARDFDNFFIT